MVPGGARWYQGELGGARLCQLVPMLGGSGGFKIDPYDKWHHLVALVGLVALSGPPWWVWWVLWPK